MTNRFLPRPLSRRRLLRGGLLGLRYVLPLPLLDAMIDVPFARARAGSRKPPLRFGVFYWAGGVVHRDWVPKKTGPLSDLPPTLTPFSGLERYLTLITGTNHRFATPGHIPARGIALSSSHDLTWVENVDVGKGYRGQAHPEPSVDVLVTERLRSPTLFDGLEIGICRKGPYKSNSSWKRGGLDFNRHEPSPQRLWDRLFSPDGRPPPAAGTRPLTLSTQLEKSLLDGLLDETRQLSTDLGARDRQRRDLHMEGLRGIERRLQERERLRTRRPASRGCAAATDAERPEQPDYGDGTGREEKVEKNAMFSRLLATALACDLTRVFSYEFSATQSHAIYWETGARMEHHPMNHAIGDSPAYEQTIRFIMARYAELATQLQGMPEGDGNVLDNTLILGTSEHANAAKHDWKDHPFLLVGRAGGRIPAGQHLRHPRPDDNFDAPRVLLSAVRAVGANVQRLGQAHERSDRQVTDGFF